VLAYWKMKGGGKRNARTLALSIGMRSMGEVVTAIDLEDNDVQYEYEPEQFTYQYAPQKYTPDFKIKTKSGKTIYIEYKGKLTSDVRKKMRFIKMCNPDKDIRIVFENSRNKLNKKSKTQYWKWAEGNNFPWAHKQIPREWYDE
jgi:hypothetical protein